MNEKQLEEHIDNVHTTKTCITCELCDEPFSSVEQLRKHNLSYHGCDLDLSSHGISYPTSHTSWDHEESITSQSDEICHITSCFMPSDPHSQSFIPEVSPEYHHQESPHYVCESCGYMTASNDHLRDHIKHCHDMRESELHCNMCCDTFNDMRLLNVHLKEHHQTDPVQLDEDLHYHDTMDISDILQVDGIDDATLSEVNHSSAHAGVTLHDPTIISANESFPNSAQAGQQLLYTLNPVNQARRLFENTDRPPLDIKYNNLQIIRGRQHPTNVTIECNSGLYLTAIKPALEAISSGWNTVVLGIVISCEDMSDMRDLSGRKVCTKQTLTFV